RRDGLLVESVLENSALIESGDERVAAFLQNVRAENARGAVDIPLMYVSEHAQVIHRFPQQLKAARPVAVAAEGVVLSGVRVVDPVVLTLIEKRETRAERRRQTAAGRAAKIGSSERSVRALHVTFAILRRLLRFELH